MTNKDLDQKTIDYLSSEFDAFIVNSMICFSCLLYAKERKLLMLHIIDPECKEIIKEEWIGVAICHGCANDLTKEKLKDSSEIIRLNKNAVWALQNVDCTIL